MIFAPNVIKRLQRLVTDSEHELLDAQKNEDNASYTLKSAQAKVSAAKERLTRLRRQLDDRIQEEEARNG